MVAALRGVTSPVAVASSPLAMVTASMPCGVISARRRTRWGARPSGRLRRRAPARGVRAAGAAARASCSHQPKIVRIHGRVLGEENQREEEHQPPGRRAFAGATQRDEQRAEHQPGRPPHLVRRKQQRAQQPGEHHQPDIAPDAEHPFLPAECRSLLQPEVARIPAKRHGSPDNGDVIAAGSPRCMRIV